MYPFPTTGRCRISVRLPARSATPRGRGVRPRGDYGGRRGRFEPAAPRENLRGLRIAYSRTLGHARVDAEVADLVDTAAKTLEGMGAVVEPVDPPWGPAGPELA